MQAQKFDNHKKNLYIFKIEKLHSLFLLKEILSTLHLFISPTALNAKTQLIVVSVNLLMCVHVCGSPNKYACTCAYIDEVLLYAVPHVKSLSPNINVPVQLSNLSLASLVPSTDTQ